MVVGDDWGCGWRVGGGGGVNSAVGGVVGKSF